MEPDEPEGPPESDDERRFLADLISRGEAVPEGTEPPPAATHEVTTDEQGAPVVRRKRFTIT
ncbi:hypothetical protein [Actinoplanes sp. NPDC020271]|uniref:hypothetical protein n=1 Tax=Actinoplanes sp. NPDC020271 TaxID=3363896 RepID=UPI00379A098A